VWKAMLFGGWAESKPTDGSAWIVKLPEDTVDGSGIMLAIAHGRFLLIPANITARSIHQSAIVANKYHLHHLLQPWIDPWTSIMSSQADCVSKTFWGWETGNETLFRAGVISMCRLSYINDAGDLQIWDSKPLSESRGVQAGPADLLGKT